MDELMTRPDEAMTPSALTETVSGIVRTMLQPILEGMGQMLQRNTEAMERIAAAQQLASDRISELEKRVRLQTPVSRTQEKYIADAIRDKAREALESKGVGGDRKAVTKLAGAIRKRVLQSYGVGTLRELPAYDYETVLRRVGMWTDMLAIREIVKEARERNGEGPGARANGEGPGTSH